LQNLSEQKLNEWREHPVTILVLETLQMAAEMHKGAICEAFLAGQDNLEDKRLRWQALCQVLEDLTEATAEDIEAWRNAADEWKRDQPG
jgi:hypothetical protein